MENDETNPYLALRKANIARNEARLRDLGLISVEEGPTTATKKPKKRKLSSTPAPPPRRRGRRSSSSLPRVQHASEKAKTEKLVENKGRDESAIPAATNPPRRSNDETNPSTNAAWVTPVKEGSTSGVEKLLPPSNSARAIHLKSQRLLFGSENMIGSMMERTGKATVMETSARLAGVNYDFNGSISFNKYSGIQEWGNNIVFLWVNLGAPNSDVVNEFLHEGRQVTWFGGSRMHSQSNAIRKLLHVANLAAAGAQDDAAIVLWCREYSASKRSFLPYVCLGRLSLVSFDEHSHPLAFVWNLLDHDYLATQNPDEPARGHFSKWARSFANR